MSASSSNVTAWRNAVLTSQVNIFQLCWAQTWLTNLCPQRDAVPAKVSTIELKDLGNLGLSASFYSSLAIYHFHLKTHLLVMEFSTWDLGTARKTFNVQMTTTLCGLQLQRGSNGLWFQQKLRIKILFDDWLCNSVVVNVFTTTLELSRGRRLKTKAANYPAIPLVRSKNMSLNNKSYPSAQARVPPPPIL